MGILLGRFVGYSAARFAPDTGTLWYINQDILSKMLFENAESIEALSVGSSHSGAIDFETLGENGFHFWRSSGDLYEVQYQLKSLLPYLPHLNKVYISVPYGFFLFDNSSRPEVTNVRRREMYATLPSWSYIEGDGENFVRGKFHHIVPLDYIMRNDHGARVLWSLLYGAKQNLIEEREGDGYRSHHHNCDYITQEELTKHAVRRVKYHHLVQERAERYTPHLAEKSFQTTKDLIRFLHENQVDVVFYTPPYHEQYNALYDVATIRHMKKMMAQLQLSQEIQYYDFSTDASISIDHRLFRDSDHLNLCGAKAFSLKLLYALSW